ncbi:MAG: (Na+)-NQR maturation NqrM [Pseudomonas sp.]|nr:(Na+)-NQR maturation NqrM [Pseudomonas sp.]
MIWLVTFIVMLLSVLGLAIGVIMGRKPLAGSCGGIANLGLEKQCSLCGGNRQKCDELQQDKM